MSICIISGFKLKTYWFFYSAMCNVLHIIIALILNACHKIQNNLSINYISCYLHVYTDELHIYRTHDKLLLGFRVALKYMIFITVQKAKRIALESPFAANSHCRWVHIIFTSLIDHQLCNIKSDCCKASYNSSKICSSRHIL